MPKQITIVVGLVTTEDGKVLLGKRHQPQTPEIHGKWEFPGGGIDYGESQEEALVRELREETGLEVEIKRLLPKVFSNVWNWTKDAYQVIILAYECKEIGGKLGLHDEEISELRYFKPEEVDYKNALPKTKEIIELLR
jgi:8-oxo-dGTP diphosphatase